MTKTKYRILYASYGAGHINMLIPVMRALRERGDMDQRILALTTAHAVAEADGFETIGFADLWRRGDEVAMRHGKRLTKGLDDSLVSRAESTAYLGLSYAELEKDTGVSEAVIRYERLGRGAFLPVNTVGRAIEDWQPNLVVTTNSPRAERAMILAAGQRGIPTLALGDMFLNKEWRWMADNRFATRVAVIGEWVRQHLIDKGRNTDSIAVTGNPVLDPLVSAESLASGKTLRARLGWESRKIIAWALPSLKPGDTRIAPLPDKLAILHDMRGRDANLRFILRAHPNQQIDFGDLGDSFYVSPRHESVHAVIHAADVLFTEFSMVGLEASLLGKPVVTNSLDDTIPYGPLGLSHDIKSIAELDDALTAALRGREGPRPNLLGAPPIGTATANVIAEIDRLLQPSGHG